MSAPTCDRLHILSVYSGNLLSTLSLALCRIVLLRVSHTLTVFDDACDVSADSYLTMTSALYRPLPHQAASRRQTSPHLSFTNRPCR